MGFSSRVKGSIRPTVASSSSSRVLPRSPDLDPETGVLRNRLVFKLKALARSRLALIQPKLHLIRHHFDVGQGRDRIKRFLFDLVSDDEPLHALSVIGQVLLVRSVGKSGRPGIMFGRVEMDRSAVRRRQAINNPTGPGGADGCKTARCIR